MYDWLIKQSAGKGESAGKLMGKKPNINTGKLKEKIINDIWRLFETEKEKRIETGNIMKVMVIKIETYHSINILMKLTHT